MISPKNSTIHQLVLSSVAQILGIFFLAVLSVDAQNLTVANPSACNLNFALADNTCPEGSSFYNPAVITIQVSGVDGAQLGQDVYLKEVKLLVEHEWVSDLGIVLRSPSGVSATLMANIGGNGNHVGDPTQAACAGAAVFSASACVPIAQGQPPFNDMPYLPEQHLAQFNDGSAPNGNWQLLICDDLADDTGILQYVELVFESVQCQPITSPVLLSQDSTSATFTYLPAALCGSLIAEVGAPGFTPGTDGNPGQGTIYLVDCNMFTLTGLPEDNQLDLYLRRFCPTTGLFSDNSCVLSFRTGCNPQPVTERSTFAGLVACEESCSADCPITGHWQNVEIDQLDWLSHSGSTPTPGTGPDDDANGDGVYLYLEGNGSGCPTGAQAYLYSSCLTLDKQGSDSCHVSFSYHAHGLQIGRLGVEVSSNGGLNWQEVWFIVGQQGNQWKKAYISLANYPDGSQLMLRIVGTKGNGIFSDLAIDDIKLHGSTFGDFPTQRLYPDLDGDGYGTPQNPIVSCFVNPPSGFADNNTDCLDSNPNIHPGAPEIPCNNIDENCNAAIIDDDLILPPPPVINDTVCSGQIPILEATASDAFSLFWYTEADRSSGVIWSGRTYSPDLPANNSPFPVEYVYYVEVTNFVCSSPVMAEVKAVVRPNPSGLLEEEPAICPGTSFDLASLPIIDENVTGANLSFHQSLPANAQNQLNNTTVQPAQTTAYYYLLSSPEGCTFMDTVTLSLLPVPIVQFSPADSFSLCRLAVDTIFASASGSPAPYQFRWASGRTQPFQPIVGADAPGLLQAFALSVTDANGCIALDTALVRSTVSIDSLRVTTRDVSTCMGSDGQIIIVPFNGLPPFAYQWANESGAFGQGNGLVDSIVIQNLPQNAYRITITDASNEGCSVNLRNIRVQGPGFQIEESDVVAPSCAGGDNGEICLNVSGSANITYQWSHGPGTACVNGLSGGQYQVTISNGECTAVETFDLVPPEPLQNSFDVTRPRCSYTSEGALMAFPYGGTPPYALTWSNGSNAFNLTGLPAGLYAVDIQDALGCQLSDTISLESPPPLQVLMDSLVMPTCPGENNGWLLVSAAGGTPPYRFAWQDGRTTPLLTQLVDGEYILRVTDFQNCQIFDTIAVNEPAPIQISVANTVQPLCQGDDTGVLELSIAGGTAPFTLYWNDGFVGTAMQRTQLLPGTYSVYAIDAQGCNSVVFEIELQPVSVITLTANIQAPACVGLGNGSISLVSNAQLPIAYEWSTGQTTSNLQNIGVGNYGLTLTDGRGCVLDTSFVVSSIQVFNIDSRVEQPSCFGVNDGIIDQTILQGGVPPYQFNWNTGSQHVDEMFLAPGQYAFTITAANGCRYFSDTFLLEYPPLLALGVEDQGNIICNGGTDGYFEVNGAGGTPPYSYLWDNGVNVGPNYYGLSAGEYALTVTDIRGCTLDTLLRIAEPPVLIAEVAFDAGNVCEPDDFDRLLSTVIGGSPPYNYRWPTRNLTPNITNPPPGDYVLTVTDANGCETISNTVKVQERIEPLVLDSFQVQQVQCFGNTDANMTAFISGGSDSLRFHFTPTYIFETGEASVSVNQLAFVPHYSVTVTDLVTGCVVSSDIILGEQPIPLAIRRDSFETIDCIGESTGALFVSVEGGTTPYRYNWTTEDGSFLSNSQDITNLPAGIYNLLVLDGNDCPAMFSDSNIVHNFPPISVVQDEITPTTCRAGSDGGITISLEGGAPPYEFEWSNGANTEDISGLAAGDFTLSVTDNQDCETVFDFTVPEPEEALDLTAMISPIVCAGNNNASIALDVVGGLPPYAYMWRRNGVLWPTANGPIVQNLAPGSYRAIVTDSVGCVFDSLFQIISPAPLVAEIVNQPLGADSLRVLVTGGWPPYSQLWSTNDTTTAIGMVSPGEYQVNVTDSEGCTTEDLYQYTSSADIELQNQSVRLFPNPNTGWFTIQTAVTGRTLLRVDLHNALGQLVLSSAGSTSDTSLWQMDASSLPPGIYTAIIWLDGQPQQTLRVVIQ